MANNVITATYSSSNITYTKPAYQYDYGMILKFSGIELPQAYEVHFSNTEFCGKSISQIGDETGVTIPDEMFLSGAPIYAWTYLHTGLDDGETVYKAVISVNKRAKPSNLEPTPVQQDAITQAIAALNVAVEQTAADVVAAGESAEAAAGSAETAGQAKDDAVEAQGKAEDAQEAAENAQEAAETAQGKAEDAQEAAEQAAGAVLGLTADASVDANTGTPSVEVNVSTVSDHKNMSFSFHNLKGDPGDPGDDGFSPVVSVSSITGGHEVAVTDKNGTQTFDVMDGTDGEDGVSPTVTVTEITGGHEVSVTDAQGTQTFDVLDGEITEDALEERLIDKADVITSSASGEIVTISDGGKDLPVVDLKVSLLPVQSGSGDPSPSNIRPISGWTGVYITQTAENLLGGVTLAETFRGCVSFALDTTNHTFNYGRSKTSVMSGVKWKENTRYTFIWTFTAQSRNNSLYIRYTDGTSEQFLICESTTTKNTIVARTASGKTVRNFYLSYSQWGTVTVYYDESGVFEGVHTASDFKPYVGQTYPIDWTDEAGTVYGCNIDPVSGVLTVTDANIASYDGETLPSTWISDRDVYAPGTTPTTGAQVVYKLATPTTYQLTPSQISTFLGTNNFWMNANGTLDLEYRCDTKLYIENLTKPSEDDMVANSNIASGKFFMIGNRLMLSTTAIAQGEQIVVGTNCSEVSLADALNQINA